ncbi:hypothetical protein vseg_006466 [Gypsophila vaccaria]
MGGATLPPGFRFRPTDEELVGYYLKRKVEKLEIELEVIPVIEFYKYDPWELPDRSFLPKRDMEWYFFSPRDRKYPNGSRTNRATKAGYWKATGKDRKVVCESETESENVIGFRKTLVFYQGRAPLGHRTAWMMYEYRLCDDTQNAHGTFALCRVVKKNGFNEKVKGKQIIGSNSCNKDYNSLSGDCHDNSSSNYSSPISSPRATPMAETATAASMGTDSSNLWLLPEMILNSSKDYSPQGHEMSSAYYFQSEFENSRLPYQPYQQQDASPSTSHSIFAEFESVDDLNQFGCMSPYSADMDYMAHIGYCDNVDVFYDGYDGNNALSYQNPNSF